MYTRKLTFRCRPSTFRAICNALSEIMTEEIVNRLRQLNIYQFTKIPAFQQDTPIIIQIMSCWNINRQAFYIGGQYLGFTVDEVALILGMPNRGKQVIWKTTPLSKYNSINIKNKIKKVKILQDSTKFVRLYIKFLITNLFFPYHNYKVPRDLYMYGENIHAFPNYNWPEAIWRFMVSQFDVIAEKIMMQKPLGYMSGFLTILMVWFFEHTSVIIPNRPAAKPRMLRWSKSNWWNTKFCTETFNQLQQQHVFETFREISKEERELLSTSYPLIHSPAILTLTRRSRSPKIDSPPASPPYSPETINQLQQRHVFETFREVSKEERELLSTTYPFIHSSAILTRRSRSPKIESPPASPPYSPETFNRLHQRHVFETFREISKEERGLPSTSYPFIHSPAILTRRSPSPKIESPPASPPYTHHSHVGTSYVSANKLSSTTTPTRRSNVNIFDLLKSLESGLENRLAKLENALISRMSDVEFILKKVEESLSGHRNPTNAKNVDKGIGTPTFELMQNEGTLQTSFLEDEQAVHEISHAQEVDTTTKSLLDSPVLRIKTGQRRKRKAISTPYIDGERKKMSKRQKKVSPKKVQGAKGHQMKRLFPWEEVVTISLDDSSDSDFEEHKQGRVKRDKKDCSSENLGDITSEGTLIRMAGMYQEYMKRIPIPTFSASVVPFTSWQSLAESLKQLYGQPLHFLTNSLLKQWDRERFGSDNERQPLDAVVHPVKAQTLIWLTEELHRLTASPYYLAKLWASDPMYHSQIDPFLSC